ncbi:hypothetical protein ACHAW6_010746 [Cyclotella cf. meneghiniana]
MMNWAKSQKVGLSMLTFLGDPNSEFTKALDLELTHPGPVSVLGPGRCKRFAMHVVDGVIKAVNVSEGPDDPVRTSVISKMRIISDDRRIRHAPRLCLLCFPCVNTFVCSLHIT